MPYILRGIEGREQKEKRAWQKSPPTVKDRYENKRKSQENKTQERKGREFMAHHLQMGRHGHSCRLFGSRQPHDHPCKRAGTASIAKVESTSGANYVLASTI